MRPRPKWRSIILDPSWRTQAPTKFWPSDQRNFISEPRGIRRLPHDGTSSLETMDRFKIERFKQENPGAKFPWFRTLDADEASNVYGAISKHFTRSQALDRLDLLLRLRDLSTTVEQFNVDAEDFSLEALLRAIGVNPTFHMYVDWGRFDQIDSFVSSELQEHFDAVVVDYLSDDVTLFDDSLGWLVFVLQYGAVTVIKSS